MTYVCNMSKDGIYCTGPNGPITLEEFRAQLDKMAVGKPIDAKCKCRIEMATFRKTGDKCLHCGRVVVKGGTL